MRIILILASYCIIKTALLFGVYFLIVKVINLFFPTSGTWEAVILCGVLLQYLYFIYRYPIHIEANVSGKKVFSFKNYKHTGRKTR